MPDEFDALAPVPSPPTTPPPVVSAAPPPKDEFDALAPAGLKNEVEAPPAGEAEGPFSRVLKSVPGAHSAAYFLQEAAKGLVQAPAAAEGLVGLIRAGAEKLGAPHQEPIPGELPQMATAQGAEKNVQSLGLNTLSPEDIYERFGGSAARAVGSNAPFLLFGPEKLAVNAGISAVSGLGGEVGKIIAPDSWWAEPLGAVAGALVGGPAVSWLSAAADARSAAQSTAIKSASLAALQAKQAEMGLEKAKGAESNLLATQQGKLSLRQVEDDQKKAVADAVKAHGVLRDQTLSALQGQIDTSKTNLDTQLAAIQARQAAAQGAAKTTFEGNVKAANDSLAAAATKRTTERDPDKIGEVIQAQGRNFLTSTLPKAEDEAWGPLNEGMLGEAVPIDNFQSRLESIGNKGGILTPIISRFAPNVGRELKGRVKSALAPDLSPEEAKVASDAGMPLNPEDLEPKTPKWEDVRQLRSAIGEAKANPMVLRDVGEQNLDSLYQATTADLQSAAGAKGLGDEFIKANSTSKALRDLADGPISSLVKSAKPSTADPLPGKLVSSLLSEAKQTGTTLQALRGEPSTALAVDELAGHVLHSLRDDPKGWEELSPGAKVALLPDGAERAQVEANLATKAGKPAEVDSAPFKAESDAASAAHEAQVAQAKTQMKATQGAYTQSVASARDSAASALKVQRRANEDLAMAQAAEGRAQGVKSAELQAKISELQGHVAAARAGMGDKEGLAILHTIEAELSSSIGEPVASAATSLLGLMDPTGALALPNKMIAATFPTVWRAAKNALAHPAVTAARVGRAGMATVGAQGSNPLSAPTEGQ